MNATETPEQMIARLEAEPTLDELPRDLDGDPYRDNGIGPWKVTHCCGAYAKGCEDGHRCRACYAPLDPFYDAPARLSGRP